MTLSGLVKTAFRSINKWIFRLYAWVKGGLVDSEEKGDEVPIGWLKGDGEKAKKKTGLKITRRGRVLAIRKVHHVPMIRTFKRGLAAVLLLFNFVFSQFLIASSSQGMVLSALFFGNVFIFIDYLWKTRSREL